MAEVQVQYLQDVQTTESLQDIQEQAGAGTSFSGGSGGGAIDTNYGGTYSGGNAGINGGAGRSRSSI